MSNVSEEGHLFGVRGSSGGYADTVFRYAAKTLFDQDIKGPLEFRTLRNSDFKEVTLEVSWWHLRSHRILIVYFKQVLRFKVYGFILNEKKLNLQVEGKTVLKFALCYGFRNLQNVVRKIKEGKSDFHYLEIMACPSGLIFCLGCFVIYS